MKSGVVEVVQNWRSVGKINFFCVYFVVFLFCIIPKLLSEGRVLCFGLLLLFVVFWFVVVFFF